MLLKRIAAATVTAALIGSGAWAVWGGWSPQAAPARAASTEDFSTIADAAFASPSRIDYQRLDARLQAVAASAGMVGMAVAIIEDGDIRFLKGYGETVAGGGEPVTTDTLFRWASLSKGVAGDMVARLAAEDRLSLNDPVARYSYSLRLPGGNEHKATVSDLLTHRLGIFSHAEDSKLESGMDARLLRSDIGTLNAICAPGQCHAYQNVAYDAASEVVEKVTGRSYRDAVREQLFLPLGMSSANMTLDGLTSAKSWARPHVGGGRALNVDDAYYRVPAAGGVNSSIKDLALWMQAQMGLQPQVLSPEMLETVQAPLAQTPGENGRMRRFRERLKDAHYGLGWRTYEYAGYKVVGHRGGVRGYRSLILFDPVRKTGVAALWNSGSGKPSGIEFEVLDMLYRLPPKDWLEVDAAPVLASAANPPA